MTNRQIRRAAERRAQKLARKQAVETAPDFSPVPPAPSEARILASRANGQLSH